MIAPLLLLVTLQQPAGDSFPHAAHARLFASCTTCHAGVISGRRDELMPQPAQCRTCHDGTTEAVVTWAGARIEPSNLRFEHRRHEQEVRREGDSALTCVTCHALAGATVFMAAGRASPERCLSCHAHRTADHLVSAPCATCHLPLRDARALSIARIQALPKPATHDDRFVFSHATEARSASCQTCHTKESCSACHVNAARVPEIGALGSSALAAAVFATGRRSYPVPPSHQARDFARGHGVAAKAPGATCASCHARESCLGCHGSDERVPAIGALPARSASAMGVDLSDRRPADHGAGFEIRHRDATAATDQACGSCHRQQFCVSCHAAASADAYHVANFVQRHSAAAYRGDTDCAACHQVTAFCSACHQQAGLTPVAGAARGAFHDGVANWLFAHGAVARRSLETCASCHTQTFCTGCHSTTRGLRVNPHGARPPAGDPNRPSCRACHR